MDLPIERWLSARPREKAVGGRLSPGEFVGGWRVAVFLGAGLSAEVYRVVHGRSRTEGALKLLVDAGRGLDRRFKAEIDAIRFRSIPALPCFLDSGEFNGMAYYVMEYLQPLILPMPRREVPRFAVRVAKAVQSLHEAGLVHRDIKPGNILRRADGEPVLIDLGLAKRLKTGADDPVVHYGGGVSIVDGRPVGVGTPDYAAPEQLLYGESSVQSDVFALGKLLSSFYEGRPPFNLLSTIRRATQALPRDRFPTAKAFASSIRHRNRKYWVGLAAVAALAAAGFFLFDRKNPPPAVKPAAAQETKSARGRYETESDYFKRMLALAKDGDVEAQVNVAEAFFHGRGTATNRQAAVAWYERAALAGNASAQSSLGLCLLRGWGCEKDCERAVVWYGRAAAQGDLAAMSDLAFCHMQGWGVDKDESKGFEWAMKAASCGHPPAQTLVGECYLDGRGVAVDTERAETWLYRAARQGNSRARSLLRQR